MSHDTASGLAGAWRLLSYSAVTTGGEAVYPMGPNACGRIIYDAGGHMAVQIGDPGRALLASADPSAAADAELRTAFGGYLAYFGTYTVDAGRGVVVHHLEMSMNPNWIGVDQVRYFDLHGNRLTLKTPPIVVAGVEGVGTLLWERLT